MYIHSEQGVDLSWCKYPEVGLPKPDAVFYLKLSAEEATKRTEFGGERYEQTSFQREVAENYQLLKEQDWKVNSKIIYKCELCSSVGFCINKTVLYLQDKLSLDLMPNFFRSEGM